MPLLHSKQTDSFRRLRTHPYYTTKKPGHSEGSEILWNLILGVPVTLVADIMQYGEQEFEFVHALSHERLINNQWRQYERFYARM